MSAPFRSRRVAGAAALTLMLLPSIKIDGLQSAAPPGPYVVTDLGTFGGVQSAHAHDINDAGQVAGIARTHAFRWQNGEMTDLGTLGGNSSSASAINGVGQVVGSANTAAPSTTHAVRWDDGAITNLTPGLPSSATGINDGGQVIGNFTNARAFLWDNNVITDLGDLGSGGAFASGINNAGQIVGSSGAHAFLWENNVMTDLGVLPGQEDSGASAINNLGQIVGSSGTTDPETYEVTSQSFLYEGGVMTALPVPSSESYAGDINDAGVVVGTMRAGGGFSNWHAYIYADGVVTNLNSRLQPGSGLHILFAHAINSDGQIVGVAYDAQAHYHAVLLTPLAPGTPVASIGDTSVSEGHEGTRSASLTVTLSPPSSQPVTLSYSTFDGTAAAGSDYEAASGTVTFVAGETSKTVSVLVDGDRAGELNETFRVNLAVASGTAVLGDSQGTGTIVDDEPRVGITSVTKNEGNSGTTPFVFAVTLSSAPTATVRLNFATANGSAVTPGDYIATSGSLSFAPGETSKTITVGVKGEKLREGQEVFYVNLSNAVGAYIPQSWGVNVQGTGVVKNDDR
jgi:probable HAF family extracellular repeat protein